MMSVEMPARAAHPIRVSRRLLLAPTTGLTNQLMTGVAIATSGMTNAMTAAMTGVTNAMIAAMNVMTAATTGVTTAMTGVTNAMIAAMNVMTAATTGVTTAMTGETTDAVVGDVSRFRANVAFIGFALIVSTSTWATSADALAQYSEATAAFQAEDFSKARALFERALAAGMEGPAVHYNIGASAYRAGDLPRAERAFREVARTPSMAALAHYNLGLVALDRRDEREARDWFERSIRQDPADERLMALASRRLAELPQPRSTGVWSYYARGGGGYDDNVALRSDSIETSANGETDSYGELNVAGNYSFGAWRLDAGAGMLEYLKLNEFSQTSFYLGVARRFRLDNWSFEFGAHGSQLSFGGEIFERNTAAGVLAARMFGGGSRLRARLRTTSVEGKGRFSGLTGDRTELGLYYDRTWRAWSFGAHTRGELNDSEDEIFATRWVQLGAEARYALSPFWGLNVGAALRRTTRPARPDTLEGWKDNRVSLLVGATRALWKQAQLYVRYEHERNDSPVAGFDYDRNRASASVEFWY
jgi:tetratricopeptide (TPR) repeat protein